MRSLTPWFYALSLVLSHSTVVQAQQVTPDGSLSTIVTSTNGKDFAVTGGGVAGTNLFHSFSTFSIPTDGSASFNAAPNIQNIFARVTGTAVSNIEGTVRSLSPANLFLLNPNGILFGPKAKLEVGGSFLGTTADRIRFSDGVVFSATDGQPLLTVSSPIGVTFGDNMGAIENRAVLNGAPGKTLGLLGGSVTLEGGRLQTFGSNIEVGSVGPDSDVTLANTPQGWTLGYGNVSDFQDIALRQGSTIDATGLGGGSIQVQGRRVSLQNASGIVSGTTGALPGGQIIVRGSESINLKETFTSSFLAGGISSFTDTNATGNASNIAVETPILSIYNGRISTGSLGTGAAGNIKINAEKITLKHQNSVPLSISGIFSTTLGSAGQGGNINITSQHILLQDGSLISTGTFGSGASGNITIQSDILEAIGFAKGQRQSSGLSTGVLNGFATGKGGDIQLNVNQLKLSEGGRISAETSGPGDAGMIDIKAKNIEIDGLISFISFNNTRQYSGIFASANPPIFPQIQGSPVFMNSNSPRTSGAAGSINLSADRITLRDQGTISVVNSSNINKLSNIDITSKELILRQGGNITTDSRGNIAGGDIRLNTNFLIALENSDITANAVNNFGGRVSVKAQGIIGTAFRSQLTPQSDITASSELGAEFSGTVELNTLNVDLNNGLTALPTDLIDSNQQVASGCNSSKDSQFIITGRGGVAVNPLHHNLSMQSWKDLRSPDSTIASIPIKTTPILEASTWQINPQGQTELIATTGSRDQQAIASCSK